MEFQFCKEAVIRNLEISRMSHSEWEYRDAIDCPTVFVICERCGVAHKFDYEAKCAFGRLFSFVSICLTDLHKRNDNTSINDGEYWITYVTRHFNFPCSNDICRKCLLEISPALMSYRDVCELDLSVTYLERAISCRKSFLKHKVKSKQQDNLERCLSMPQRVFSMETWTWIEHPHSTV